jgi:hypothetical protein
MKLSPLFLLAASPILASGSLDQRISRLEQQMEEARMCSVLGTTGANTASATHNLCLSSYIPSLFIEMLYWQPFIGGSEFAYTNGVFPVTNSPFVGKIAEQNCDWQFGFRTGLSYRFSSFDWTLSADFARLTFENVEHAGHPNGGVCASGLPNASNETSAKAMWAVSFNVLDVDLSRPYFLRPRFSLNPRIGVRTAWIKQHDHAHYFNASNNESKLLKYVNATTGIGIFGGTQMNWYWSNQWSLFGGATGSLIYGKMKVAAKSMNFTESAATVPLDVSADTYKVLPNLSVDTGLQWQMAWKYVSLSLAAGYEFQYWWRQNQRLHLDDGATYSWVRFAEDLGFQGLNIRAALDF